MAFEELPERYLDRHFNPFLPESDAEPFPEKTADPDAKYLDPVRNPMIGVEDVRAGIVEAAILSDRLARAFEDKNELELGGFKVERMADNSFRVGGKTLAELPAETLSAIDAAIR